MRQEKVVSGVQHTFPRSALWGPGGTFPGISEWVEYQKRNTAAGVCASNPEVRQGPSPRLRTAAPHPPSEVLLLFSSVRHRYTHRVAFPLVLDGFPSLGVCPKAEPFMLSSLTVQGTKRLSCLQVIWVVRTWRGAYPDLPSPKQHKTKAL